MTGWDIESLKAGMRAAAEFQVGRLPDDPEIQTLMLADLGQKVLNAIANTKILGHTRLAHTSAYVHTDDPAARLVTAVLDGNIDKVDTALARWRTDGAAVAEQVRADYLARVAS